MNQAYAALEWTAKHAEELGADPSRIAVAGNSVGGDMTAALTLMAKDPEGTKDQLSGATVAGHGRRSRYLFL